VPEIIVFLSVVFVYLAASILGVLQLTAGGERYKRFLSPLVCLAVVLEAVLLIFRAVVLKAVPLTGLFESMIVLTIVFALIYLFFSIAIHQVWFGSVMAWVSFAMILMAGIAAKPASEPYIVATTPWAIAHGIVMILGIASIAFATASAFLYLVGSRLLKQKRVMQVLGKIPNIEKLECMNLFGVKISFVLTTMGIVSGFGLASMLGTGITAWLTDGKVTCSIAAWVLLGAILVLNYMFLLKSKTRAYVTIVTFVLLLLAILGVTILGVTQHNFSQQPLQVAPLVK